jgi:hypothetical protein
MLEVELSTVGKIWRGSVCGRVCRYECCSNAVPSLKSKMIWKHHKCSSLSLSLPLESNKTVHYITSSPLSTYCVMYMLYILILLFCHQRLFELFLHGVLKVTVRRLYPDHKEKRLYLQLANSRK